MKGTTRSVQEYWDTHHLGTQFLHGETPAPGTQQYYLELDRVMERWPYKNGLLDWTTSQAPQGMLLEIGCGLGQDLAKFAGRGMSVVGIDLAPTVAARALQRLRLYELEGAVLCGDAENLGFPSGSFDVVYSCGVLQHTPDIQRAVSEIHRVTKKGGLAVVVVYHRYSWFNLLSRIAKTNIEFEDQEPPILNTYSRGELRRMFSQFDKVRVELEYSYPSPTSRKGVKAALYNRVFIPAWRMVPLSVARNFGWHAVVKAVK